MQRRTRILLALATAPLALAALEFGLRRFWTPARSAYVWPPELDTVYRADPAILPGVDGLARFHIGSHGLRAREFDDADVLRIACVGGSTTECLFLDTEESWPGLLEQHLAAGLRSGVWVGNAGKSGHAAREHVEQVEELCAGVPELDLVLVLAGANDLCGSLAHAEPAGAAPPAIDDPAWRAGARRAAFMLLPVGEDARGPLQERCAIARALQIAKNRLLAGRPRAHNFDVRRYARWREQRAAASELRDELPDLGPALALYRSRLERMIASAHSRGIAIAFATQPATWRAGLAPERERLLWMGGAGDFQNRSGAPYWSAGALARGLADHNRVLEQVCAARGAPCLDLAALLDRADECFYDDVHFTEEGARRVAAAWAERVAALARERGLGGVPRGR